MFGVRKPPPAYSSGLSAKPPLPKPPQLGFRCRETRATAVPFPVARPRFSLFDAGGVPGPLHLDRRPGAPPTDRQARVGAGRLRARPGGRRRGT